MEKRDIIKTDRLILRPWSENDAEDCFKYAKDPDVGPITGFEPHKTVDDSRYVIKNFLSGDECYAVCLKEDGKAIGSIEIMHGEPRYKEKEGELGFWIGKPFWGNGYIPEASEALIDRAFTKYNLDILWCGFYEGNTKSNRTQDKLGFVFHHYGEPRELPMLGERKNIVNYMTREMWEEKKKK